MQGQHELAGYNIHADISPRRYSPFALRPSRSPCPVVRLSPGLTFDFNLLHVFAFALVRVVQQALHKVHTHSALDEPM
jgi:hypothetical protein